MADSTIGDLPTADPLTGSEWSEVEQDGVAKKTPVSSYGSGAASQYPGNAGSLLVSHYTDFAQATPWDAWNDVNSNGAISSQSIAGTYGVKRLSTGSNAAGRRLAITNDASIRIEAGMTLRHKTKWKLVDAVPDATNDYQILSGFATNFTSTQTSQMVGFVFDRLSKTGGGNLGANMASTSGTFTSIGLDTLAGITITNFNVFEIVIVGGESITFNVNGDEVYSATDTALIPTSLLMHGIGIRKIAGTTARQVDVDWMAYEMSWPGRT